MRRFLHKLLHGQSGQGMSEYLIIVALVAVAAIGVTSVFGRDIRELFSATTDSLTGGKGDNNGVKAKVDKSKNMKNFGHYGNSGD
jgi:pilus assembly protein Flp/PilA